MSNCFEILAVKYATVDRARQSNFLNPVDGDPDAPMALDFFVWLVVGHGTVLLVDTGFSSASALVRNRQYLVSPMESVRRLGYTMEEVKDVVITHLHYDHAGNLGAFPNAKLWVQDREVRYATGDCMCDPKQNHFFSTDDVACLINQGNVQLVDGFHELRDGIELHRVGGHTDGLQVVRVRTARGWVVLASDAAHYRENLLKDNPFPAIYNLDDMLLGYARIRELADGEENIVPGHDPQVCVRFPSVGVPGVHAYRIA
jgi:glyoxylase-like metal-dependent hydrolase (beta-lactamase superfamily II)